MANPGALRDSHRSFRPDHERLPAWRLAAELAMESYQITATLPLTGGYTLMARIRGAAALVLRDIEGTGSGAGGDVLPHGPATAEEALLELERGLRELDAASPERIVHVQRLCRETAAALAAHRSRLTPPP